VEQPGPRARPFDYQQHIHNQSHPDILPFLRSIGALCDAYGAFTVAEVGGDHALTEMHAFTSIGRLSTAYGFDFLYADALTPRFVLDTLMAWPDAPGVGWPSWAFSNHDSSRAVSRWATPDERAERARLDMLLLVSLRGNIFLYQGEELGLPQAELTFDQIRDPEAIANWPLTRGRDGARTPMPWRAAAAHAGFSTAEPWLPIGAGHAALAVDRAEADSGSQLALTRRLLALRQVRSSLRLGALAALDAPASLLAFERVFEGERTLCLFNLGRQAVDWRPADRAAWRIAEAVNGAGLDHLPPGSGLIAFWQGG
jgi:alpha-glucosidase